MTDRFVTRKLTYVLLMTSLTACLGIAQPADQKAQDSSRQNTPAAASPANAAQPSASQGPREFVFDGGDLNDFISRVDKHFGMNLRNLATIDVPSHTRVPKMRVGEFRGWTSPPTDSQFESVIRAYNKIAENGRPELGKWFISMAGRKNSELPGILTLTPISRDDGVNSVKVRAFSVQGLSAEQRKKLETAILEAQAISINLRAQISAAPLETSGGSLQFNSATYLMLAFGPEAFLEMTESIVKEYRQSLGPLVRPIRSLNEAEKPKNEESPKK